MRREFVNPPRTPREQYYASRQQFQQYCTARREIANIEDNGNTERKTTENNRRRYNPPNVQQECIYRDIQNNWNNGGQNVNYNRWYNQHENVDQFNSSSVRITTDNNSSHREINYSTKPYSQINCA